MSALSLGLSRADQRQLDERGLVKLPGLVPRRACEEMAERIWQELARKDGVRRGHPATWTVERPAQFKALTDTGAFKAMATPGYRAVLDDLMGAERWEAPKAWGQPLVCFPRRVGRWDVPYQSWHLDLPAHPKHQSLMVGRTFTILAPLRPGGGGTLVATGSHRVTFRLAETAGAQQSSALMRKRLKTEHRWFHDLMTPDKRREDRIARFMRVETDVGGVACRVEEMTGEPGDVYVMHPAALHAGASNMLDAPRLVLAQTVYPKSWFGV
jgi:hypothetical protein